MHQARIDFVFTRHHFADAQAKQIVQLLDFPLLSDIGFHVPMIATLPTRWKGPQLFTMKQRQHCRQLRTSGDASWTSLHDNIHHDLKNIQTHDTDVVDSIHATVAQHFNSQRMTNPDYCPVRTDKFRSFWPQPPQKEPPNGGGGGSF